MTLVRCEKQRLAVLFDADNVEILGEGRRVRIDLPKVLDRINHCELTRAIYYKPARFFSEAAQRYVQAKGFEAKATCKNSDAWFIMDAVALANKCDVIAFVGVDRDLEPVIPVLKSMGVRVEGWAWESKVSEIVRGLLDGFVPLTPDFIIDDPPDR